MRNKKVLKEFIKYISFNIMGQLAYSCYTLADTFFVSSALGSNGLAALNLAFPVLCFINGIGLMIGIGGGTKFTVSRIRGEKDKADKVFTNSVYLVILFSFLFVLTGMLLSGKIVHLLGADDSIFTMTNTYLRTMLFFAPAFLTNKGDVKAILRYSFITVVLLSAAIYSVIFFGAQLIAAVFNSEHNEVLQQIAVTGLKIYFISCPFVGFNVIASTCFASTENPKPANIISILRGFIIIIPMAFLMSALLKMLGVWLAFPLTEFVAAVTGIGLFKYGSNKRI